ncbi:hypothetical protein MIR68_001924 [Amoeboaphelidium protococcarum]|nr:hypothetical protein MIR68_001924 [Amoeboaphelidium protococcarum]
MSYYKPYLPSSGIGGAYRINDISGTNGNSSSSTYGGDEFDGESQLSTVAPTGSSEYEQYQEQIESGEAGGKYYRFRVQNFPQTVRAIDLHDHFEQFGHLIKVQVLHDNVTNRSKTTAFLTFKGFPTKIFDKAPIESGDGGKDDSVSMYVKARRILGKTMKISIVSPDDQSGLEIGADAIFNEDLFTTSSIAGAYLLNSIQIGTLVEPNALFSPITIRDEPFLCVRPNESTKRWQVFLKLKSGAAEASNLQQQPLDSLESAQDSQRDKDDQIPLEQVEYFKMEFGFSEVLQMWLETSDPVELAKCLSFNGRDENSISGRHDNNSLNEPNDEQDVKSDTQADNDYELNCKTWLAVDLKNCPRLYRGEQGVVEEHGIWQWKREEKMVWVRVLGLPGYPEEDGGAQYDQIDFTSHRIYRFELKNSAINLQNLLSKWNQMYNGDLLQKKSSSILPPKKSELMDLEYHQQEFVMQNVEKPMKLYSTLPFDLVTLDSLIGKLPFAILYRLHGLCAQDIVSKYILTPYFVETIQKHLAQNDDKVVEAVLELFYLQKKRLFFPAQDFEACKKQALEWSQNKHKLLPPHCMQIRKVVVTPRRIIALPPSVELGNRVLRHYQRYQDYFLRVAFTEESLSKFLDGPRMSSDLTQRISQVLKKKLNIAGREYEFLAFSSSQLRSHSCWFFCACADLDDPSKMVTAQTIRDWMGDFSNIKTVAKFAARLGQCFSSTTPVNIESQKVIEIPDIERNGYNFSDGIGKISPVIAKAIANAMQLIEIPSAFQVRMGGYKGVLAVDPTISDQDALVQFRPSQKKFITSHQSSLDIIRTSLYSPAYLNHQIITLLSSMQVRDNVFMDLQRAMQEKLEAIQSSSTVALETIRPHASENETLLVLCKMLHAGVKSQEDVFVRNLLHLYQCSKLKEVKQKARIIVPNGVQLMGVLDETNTLEYGQLYVQFSDPKDLDGNRQYVVKGTVLMAKMPSVHPGDIRILDCIDDPRLQHYKNVIVFPQKGPRPHPNEASGSDLDGDIYFVTWDKNLIPPFQNFYPQDYENQVNPVKKDNISMDDIADFMVDYITNDNLGLIAVAHKIHADLSFKGVHSEKCIQLSKLHSMAVDFPKTGVPAPFNPLDYTVEIYPDFLGRRDRPSYPSKKALGKLYRDAHWKNFQPSYDVRLNPVFLINDFEEYLVEALWLKQKWDAEVQVLMSQNGIRSEFECISGLIMDYSKWMSKKEFELKKSLADILRNLALIFRAAFWEKIGFKAGKNATRSLGGYHPTDMASAYRKAAAFYYVTYAFHSYREMQSKSGGKEGRFSGRPMLSFPWLVAGDVLLEIYKMRQENSLSEYSGVPRVDWNLIKVEAAMLHTDVWSVDQQKVLQQQQQSVANDKEGGSELQNEPEQADDQSDQLKDREALYEEVAKIQKGKYDLETRFNELRKEIQIKNSISIPDLVADGTLDQLLHEAKQGPVELDPNVVMMAQQSNVNDSFQEDGDEFAAADDDIPQHELDAMLEREYLAQGATKATSSASATLVQQKINATQEKPITDSPGKQKANGPPLTSDISIEADVVDDMEKFEFSDDEDDDIEWGNPEN